MVDNILDRMSKRMNEKADKKEQARKQSVVVDKPIQPEPKQTATIKTAKVKTKEKVSNILLPSGNSLETYQAYIDPKMCRIWEGNNRLEETRNDHTLEDLKNAIEAQGQVVPGFVRPIIGDSKHKYEVIYGSRRFAACSALNKKFLAQVGEVADKDALIMMDAENNARKELSVYEKASSYHEWLKNGYFKNRNDLAEHLGVSPGWISKVQSILKLPEEVLAAFSSKADIKIWWAMELLKTCKSSDSSKNILVEFALKKPERINEPEQVYQYLLKAGSTKAPALQKEKASKPIKIKIENKSGNMICEIESSPDGKLKATFSKGIKLETVKETLEKINFNENSWEI